MRRQIGTTLAILAVAAGVQWKLATHPETSTPLENVRLVPCSEHSHPGPTDALAGIRIRLSPSDFDDQIRATPHAVSQIALAGE
jgi:hypothetical protein